jgi:hypothetical protein
VLSLSLHRAIELIIGLALAVLSLALSGGTVASVVGIALGLLVATLSFAGDREGRARSLATHATIDRILAATLAVAAVALLLADERAVAAVCAAAAIAEAVLTLTTRYIERPGRDDESTATTVATS